MNKFYNGKRVLVTGGEGFVGSRLCQFLIDVGANVFSLDNQSRGRKRIEGVTYIVADAANPTSCKYAMSGGNSSKWATPVDVVFNLAASVAGVLHNMNHHLEMFHGNIGLQTVPLMVAEQLGIENLLQVSSVCTYSDDVNHPSREDTIGGEPNDANYGYAWAKRMGEKMADVCQLAKVVVVRPSNIFGIGDYFDDKAQVIPALIKRALSDDSTFDLYGPGEYTREFIYVDDVARGMMVAMANGKTHETYNIGTNGMTRITMIGLAEMILHLTGTDKTKTIVHHLDKGGGDPHRWADASKLNALGWNHEWRLDNGIEETIEWYKKNVM